MHPDEFVKFYGSQKASAILRTTIREAAAPAMEAPSGMVCDRKLARSRVVSFTIVVFRTNSNSDCDYHPLVPAPPLKGPMILPVIQPP